MVYIKQTLSYVHKASFQLVHVYQALTGLTSRNGPRNSWICMLKKNVLLMHACTHMYIWQNTHIHMCIHTYTHIHTHTYVRAHTHTYVRAHTHTHTHTHTHMHTCVHIHKCTHTTHTHTHTHTHTLMNVDKSHVTSNSLITTTCIMRLRTMPILLNRLYTV